MNLHSIVRPAINTVNPEMSSVWRRNTGYGTADDGSRVPLYTTEGGVPIQVQALTGKDLLHKDLLNIQGVMRKVYMYSNAQGVVRVNAKGGDLLQFPQDRGGDVYVWKVCAVLETWNPDAAGWCCVAVVLQEDAPI